MKKVTVLLLAYVLLLLTGCAAQTLERDPDRLHIVATVFPAYDFARSAAGELADVTMLLPPGAESHSYEPTPADILAVQECDLFIYLGGESDVWVETILSAVEPKGTAMRMVDCVDLLEEAHAEGMQVQPSHDHDHDRDEHCDEDHDGHEEANGFAVGAVTGMDEHVWTAPENAAEITRRIGEKLAELDQGNAAVYREQAAAYAVQLDGLDQEFRAFFEGRQDRTIVFGDRFPLQYFAKAFELDYYAAFPGCGTQTEPSAATVAFLTEKVREEQIPTVWYIEFSNHLVADSIAEATGTKTAMFHTCHNVTRQEIESGATYLSLMQGNLETLRQHFD